MGLLVKVTLISFSVECFQLRTNMRIFTMANILVFQHHFAEGLGTLADLFRFYGHATTTIRLDVGEMPPESMVGYGALVVMGGPMSANDEDTYPWLREERSFVRDSILAGLPTIGHCLGAQIIAKALGAQVVANPLGQEIGWWPLLRSAEHIESPWIRDLPDKFSGFHWHGETFSLPEGAVHLLSSVRCENQMFSYGEHCLALQWHPEVTAGSVDEWVHVMGADLEKRSDGIQTSSDILEDVEHKCTVLAHLASFIYTPWIMKVR
jgi:GMP synthase-like glutamine amidotransferase